MFYSKGRLVLPEPGAINNHSTAWQLAMNGFVTAIANPKGWAFFITLLPPFLDQSQPLAPQLTLLIALILLLEFGCLLIYASGGKMLRYLLMERSNVKKLNRLAGSLMIGIGGWLAFG